MSKSYIKLALYKHTIKTIDVENL